MKESSFWKELRDGFAKLPLASYMYCHRIENGVGRGQPDVAAAYQSREVWLELKVLKGHRIEIRYSQFAWLRRRRLAGMFNTYIVARAKDHIEVWYGETILSEHGPTAIKARATEKSLIFVPPEPDFMTKGLKPADYAELRSFLFRP